MYLWVRLLVGTTVSVYVVGFVLVSRGSKLDTGLFCGKFHIIIKNLE